MKYIKVTAFTHSITPPQPLWRLDYKARMTWRIFGIKFLNNKNERKIKINISIIYKNSMANNGKTSWRPADRMCVGRKRQLGDSLCYFQATFGQFYM